MSEGKKMSKSLGNFVSREEIARICAEYSVDVYRYYLLRATSFGSDGDFSAQMLRQTYNAELANGIGNLLSRTVQMIGKYFDALVPAPVPHLRAVGEGVPTPGADPSGQDDLDNTVQQAAADLAQSAAPALERCQFGVYLDKIIALATATNVYIEQTAPFKLAKDPAQKDRLATILYTCASAVRIILLHLLPVMPKIAADGLGQLGCAREAGTLSELGQWGKLAPGTKTSKGEGLFPRKA